MSEYVNYESKGYSKRMERRELMQTNNVVQSDWNNKVSKQKQIIVEKTFTKEEEEMIEILFDAVKNKAPKFIYSILKDGAFPDKKDKEGNYPLHYAIERKDAFEVIKIFFDAEFKYIADINAQNKNKQTVLHIACSKKETNTELTNYLLEKGSNPNVQDAEGNTCLHLLTYNSEVQGNDVIMQQCLDWGGNLEISNFRNQQTAQLTSNEEYQRMFMEHKFDLNETCTGGDIEVGFSWKNLNDLDLHCNCRCGSHIFYSNKKCSNCKGYLDFDMNVTPNSKNPNETSSTPVEHIYWPHIVPGKYLITAVFYRNHPGIETDSEYFIFMNVKGDLVYKTKGVLKKDGEEHKVFAFEVDSEKQVKIIEVKDYDVKPSNTMSSSPFGSNQQIQIQQNDCMPQQIQIQQNYIPQQIND
eukprot:gene3244-5687_t